MRGSVCTHVHTCESERLFFSLFEAFYDRNQRDFLGEHLEMIPWP